MSRQSASGVDLGGVAIKSVAQALALHSGNRRIATGMPADLAVVGPDPLAMSTADLPTVRAVTTIVAGRLVRRDGLPSQ